MMWTLNAGHVEYHKLKLNCLVRLSLCDTSYRCSAAGVVDITS